MASSTSNTLFTAPSQYTARNRGPITTLFVPPTSCTATPTFTILNTVNIFYFGHSGQDRLFDPTCYPTGTIAPQSLKDAHWGLYYYSPAICPKGWNQAWTYKNTLLGYTEDLLLGTKTTAVLCCPISYTSALDGAGHPRISTINQDDIVPLLYASDTKVRTYTHAAATPAVVVGDGVVVMWQESDKAILDAAAAESPATKIDSTNTAAIPTSTWITTSPTTVTPSKGMSTGAKAGISVGTVFAVLAALAAGWLLLTRRKSRTQNKSEPTVPTYLGSNDAVEVCAAEPPREIYSGRVIELHHELPPDGYTQDLTTINRTCYDDEYQRTVHGS